MHKLRRACGACECVNGVWRLTYQPQWLDARHLRQSLADVCIGDGGGSSPCASGTARAPGVSLIGEVGSTNKRIRRYKSLPYFLFAEYQRRGRGSYGRQWLALPADSITMSAAFVAPEKPSGLSVAVGGMLCAALAPYAPLRFKWPNDILDGAGRKVAGILTEITDSRVIIGIGLNWAMPSAFARRIAEIGTADTTANPTAAAETPTATAAITRTASSATHPSAANTNPATHAANPATRATATNSTRPVVNPSVAVTTIPHAAHLSTNTADIAEANFSATTTGTTEANSSATAVAANTKPNSSAIAPAAANAKPNSSSMAPAANAKPILPAGGIATLLQKPLTRQGAAVLLARTVADTVAAFHRHGFPHFCATAEQFHITAPGEVLPFPPHRRFAGFAPDGTLRP